MGARSGLAVAVTSTVLVGGAADSLAQPVPLGDQFQVNQTLYLVAHPEVAVTAQGAFLVVWESSYVHKYPLPDVKARLYASDGTALSDEFLVNGSSPNGHFLPQVSVSSRGDSVIVWSSWDQDGSESGVLGRRYAADGSALGAEFPINTYTANAQAHPHVAHTADGGFVAVWDSDGSFETDSSNLSIQAQRYDAAANPIGSQFQVNTYTTGSQAKPHVARAAGGGFAVVWESDGSFETDASGLSIQAQRYASDGSRIGGQFQVNSYAAGDQSASNVGSNAAGAIVVAWRNSQESSAAARRYAADGTALGLDVPVVDDFSVPSVSVEPCGGFIVLPQRYSCDGTPLGRPFQIATSGEFWYRSHAANLASIGTGNSASDPTSPLRREGELIVVVWVACGPGGCGPNVGPTLVRARRFSLPNFQTFLAGPTVAPGSRSRARALWCR